jgi:hypothetical protein
LVSRTLSSTEHGPWLLVLDNIDDQDTLVGVEADRSLGNGHRKEPLVNFLPRGPHGSTLITTRDHSVARLLAGGEIIKVDYMDFPAAQALFESRVPLDAALDKTKTLECLSLAISQAAAYIAHYGISVEDYLELLSADDREMGELLDAEITDTRRDWESRHSVFRTWKVSFDKITASQSRAAEILCLLAVLDRQGIPEDVLKNQMRPERSSKHPSETKDILSDFGNQGRRYSGNAPARAARSSKVA